MHCDAAAPHPQLWLCHHLLGPRAPPFSVPFSQWVRGSQTGGEDTPSLCGIPLSSADSSPQDELYFLCPVSLIYFIPVSPSECEQLEGKHI